jgi:rubrerythrin
MKQDQLKELLLQSLEHEKGGTKIYETALKCAINDDLKKEWSRYLEHTRKHVTVLTDICEQMGYNGDRTPGCEVVHHIGISLTQAMEKALSAGTPEAAQIVAAECVVFAETKDHLDWELIGECAKKLKGDHASQLKDAYDEIEDEEDEHLYHTRGWCRELWAQSLGMKAVLPPPEEKRHVTTAIDAAKAQESVRR